MNPTAHDPSAGDRAWSASDAGQVNAPGMRPFVMALFFVFGGLTSLNDVLIPRLKELFTLTYAQAMLVQFCFFSAYLLVGLPAAALVKRIGYMRGAFAGLALMMAGCVLFVPASSTATYSLFLLALFVLAAGVVVVQVVANPLISVLGPVSTVHSRLTFAQAFNSLGTTVFPPLGAMVMLGALAAEHAADLTGPALDAFRAQETSLIVRAYLVLALALAVVAAAVWRNRNALTGERHSAPSLLGGLDLVRQPRFAFGTLCIFLYVGAEVSIGSMIVSYLMQTDVLALDQQSAGKVVGLYWGGAMMGRFIGSAVLRVVAPGRLLAFAAVGAVALIACSAGSVGAIAAYALLAVGLMNSIMFPTIFSLACEGLGERVADGSGIINMAIFGGAVVPLLTGVIADHSGSLASAFALPAACYGIIAAFAAFATQGANRP